MQRPCPPIWVGAARTPESFAWAGRNGFDLMVLPYMFPAEFLQERLDIYRGALAESGHSVEKAQIMAKFHVFVADSAEEARAQAAPAYDNYQRVSGNRSGREFDSYWRAGSSYDQHVSEMKFIGGTPEDCIKQIQYWEETLGLTQIAGTFHFGGLSQESTLRSLRLFASEVAPRFSDSHLVSMASPASRL